MAGAAATYALGKLTGSPRVTQVGADLVRAQIVAQGVTAAIKMSVTRGRPDGTEFSFPSGHASVTFASATVLQRNFGWKVGVPAYGVAAYVAASRIQAKRHFLSDVAFGAAIGIAAGRTVTIGHGGGRFALAPIAAPGGAGVSFTWVGQR
jgi:membrane-associated phospholipid phosphatase